MKRYPTDAEPAVKKDAEEKPAKEAKETKETKKTKKS